MSSRIGFALATILLLLGAGVRFWNLAALPPGFSADEITAIRIAETVRNGNVSVFYNLESLGATGGREGLYPTLLAATTAITGRGLISYRLLSVMASILMLAVIYALATRLYGPLGGVAALALLVLGLWPTILARTVGRDALLLLLIAGVLLALARALPVYYQAPPREPGTTPFAALGLLLGLGFYIHPAHLLLVLGVIIFIIYMVASPHKLSRRTLSYIGFAILMMIIVAMPYLISSIRLPDLAAASRLLGDYHIWTKPPLAAIFDSLVGIVGIGDESVITNVPGRPLVDPLSGLLIIVGVVMAVRNWRRPRFLLPLVSLLFLLPVAFLSNNSPDFQTIVVILPMLALFFGLGVTSLYTKLKGQAQLLLWLGFVALLGFNVVWLTQDLFVKWPQVPAVYASFNGRLGQIANHIDRTAHTLPTVICTPTISRTTPRSELSETQLLLLMMHSRNRDIRYADCGTGLILTNGGEHQQIIMTNEDSLADVHPYLQDWLMRGKLQATDDLPPDAVILMNVSAQLADKIGEFTTTTPVTYAPEAPGGAEVTLPPVAFGGNVTFLGYEHLPPTIFQPGDIITSIGYWRVEGPPPPDIRLFTHVLSDPVAIISQTDTLSVLATQLRPRDVFIQITFVQLPNSTPAGNYTISIGAYQDTDDMRLPVLVNNQARGTRLFLAANTITVE